MDAGGLALSKDRSTEAAPQDYGFGLVLDIAGTAQPMATRWCAAPTRSMAWWKPIRRIPLDLPVGAKLRIAPNHTCMTAAAHDRYFVVEGGDEVVGNLAAGERLVEGSCTFLSRHLIIR